MTVGLAAAELNSMLDAFARGVSYGGNAALWVKLHVGDPGAAGTANAAANTTRVQATFGSAASGGAISNTAAVLWEGVSTTETYSHCSLWSASTAGTFKGSSTVTGGAVTAGNDFQLKTNDIDITASPVAA